jgi:ATP synthase protein I
MLKPVGSYPLMFRAVAVQVAATVVAAVFAGALGGGMAALSAAAGGACCVLPNAWFAARLWRELGRPGGAQATAVLVGEMFKIALTIAMMVAFAILMRGMNWWAFLAAFVLALKSSLVLLMARVR